MVFRPYTQLWRSICTSETLRTSTRVSPGFILAKHSSLSFGSQHLCSGYPPTHPARPPPRGGRRPFVMASPGPAPPPPPPPPRERRRAGRAGAGGDPRRPGEESQSLRPGARGRPLLRGIGPITFIAPVGLVRPLTRIHVGLLGPCFKTGREEYRLFARREGHAGEGLGSAGASELGSTAASDQSPVPGRPRRSDRRGSKTRAPGDPRTGALENAPRPTRSGGRTRRRFLPGPGPQTPVPNASRRPTAGGRSPAGAGQAAGAAPRVGSFGRGLRNGKSPRPLPSPGRPTN